jgi:hypothetical protein
MASLAIRVEQALLGSVLLEPAEQQHVLDLIEPGDMCRPWHAQVLLAMQRARSRGSPPEPAEVYEELRKDPDLPGTVSRDAVALIDLMEAAPNAQHCAAYAAIVGENGIRQRMELTGPGWRKPRIMVTWRPLSASVGRLAENCLLAMPGGWRSRNRSAVPRGGNGPPVATWQGARLVCRVGAAGQVGGLLAGIAREALRPRLPVSRH